jgi:hypothetical protein
MALLKRYGRHGSLAAMRAAGAFSAMLVVSGVALADGPTTPTPTTPPTTSAAHTPAYGALPAGNMTAPPKDKAPARIPKTESVDGFAVGDPPKNQLRDGKITNVIIFAKDADAKDYTAGKAGFSSTRAGSDSVCFARRSERGVVDEGGAGEWAFDMEPTTRISAPWKPPPPLPKGAKATPKLMSPVLGDMEVTAVHQERFFADNGKARVEMTDVWVDPVTHGARLIGKSTLTLDRVGVSQGGVTLYAARGDKALHVVARRERLAEAPDHAPTTPRDFRLLSASRMPLMIEKSDGQMDATQCGFAHVSLKAQKGTAEMATFETQTVFVDPPSPKKIDDDAVTAMVSGTPPKEDEPELRVRPLRATVSSTWATRDKEPVLSVSFGWAGRERQL